MLGLGHDIVALDDFAEDLAMPVRQCGLRRLFSTREWTQAAQRAELKADGLAVHLAAKWAGKESVIKAWCEAAAQESFEPPYTVDNTPWAAIEILDDSRGVPHVVLSGETEMTLRESLQLPDVSWHLSLSHDGPVASAVAILTSPTGRRTCRCV
ncbi:holo-ACP synthase [Bifidobacterium choloepi]|uniref:Holo-[acyl-carrier-protein] synthase n=1 Tax=Bifidobacterium choloepi TaxID=2614131 RepID=A0A6I5N799_9BIFI|nr:4'-phosphopantetheinyl transferase superfamily protein [Bifidobacterium choloepi]